MSGEWHMQFVYDGHAALRALAGGGIDLVVSDVDMPGMSGIDLLPHITGGQFGFLPVIIVTGNGQRSLKTEALTLGAADLLTKPVDVSDLIARIRSVLTIKGLHDELSERNESLESAVAARTRELDRAHIELVVRLAKAAELRDEDTGRHVIRVSLFSGEIAEALGLEPGLCREIRLASALHDVGKLGVPDAILRKPGFLTAEERTAMQDHAQIGFRILTEPEPMLEALACGRGPLSSEIPRLQRLAASIALTHHERWDGTGYPNGLSGENIPVEGRVVAAADVYDALRSNRPYKSAFSQEASLKILVDGSGSHFDPTVIEAVLRCVHRLSKIEADAETAGESTMVKKAAA